MNDVLTFYEIKIETPTFDPHPEKSNAENHTWRQVMTIYFKNNKGDIFSYTPKWSEITRFSEASKVTELANKEICKNYWREKEKE